jgi:hypothetical protein
MAVAVSYILPMPRKPQQPRPIEDPAEYQRFIEAARALGADESPDALDRALEKVTTPNPAKKKAQTT